MSRFYSREVGSPNSMVVYSGYFVFAPPRITPIHGQSNGFAKLWTKLPILTEFAMNLLTNFSRPLLLHLVQPVFQLSIEMQACPGAVNVTKGVASAVHRAQSITQVLDLVDGGNWGNQAVVWIEQSGTQTWNSMEPIAAQTSSMAATKWSVT